MTACSNAGHTSTGVLPAAGRCKFGDRPLLVGGLSREAASVLGMPTIGIHLGRDASLAAATARGADCVQFFLGDPQGWKVPPPGDHAMARRLDTLARLWERVGDLDLGFCLDTCLGFCLDTCHAHAGGEELHGIVDRVKAITGRIDLVHANDSKDPAGSGRDRHENLGRGRIDLDTLVAVVQAAGAPVVCETPGGPDEHRADIELLRGRLGG